MSFRESYLLWKLTYDLISRGGYRLIFEANNGREVWLKKFEGQGVDLIHISQYTLDWSNWVRQHNEQSIHQAKEIQRQIHKKKLSILNLYISPFRPVDNGLELIDQWYQPDHSKHLSWYLLILDQENQDHYLQVISNLSGCELGEELLNSPEETDILQYREMTKQVSNKHRQMEQKIFQHGKPFLTYLFIAIQLVVFGWMEYVGSSVDSKTLLEFGAKFNPLILDGEWFRFITPIFLHIGFLHLLMNTIAVYYLGSLVERIYGSPRFFFIYMISGIIGAITSFAFNSNLSAGASGAIYGLFGSLLFFGMFYPKVFFSTMGYNIFVVLAINIGITFTIPGIDISGHFGGLIAGFIASGVFHLPRKKQWALQLLFLVITVAMGAGLYSYGKEKGFQAEDGDILAHIAFLYVEAGDSEKAYELLNIYDQEKGEPSALVYFNKAYIEFEKGQYKMAQSHLEEAIKISPEFHEAYYNLSLIYFYGGLQEEALELANKALSIDPRNNQYQQWVDELK